MKIHTGCKNKYKIVNEVTTVYIVKNGITHEVLIDTEEFLKIKNKYKRFSFVLGTRGIYLNCNYKSKVIHRVIMNAPDGFVVDHINHDFLDNRKVNLRIVTQKENMLNCRVTKRNKSGYLGVYWDKKSRKWAVTVKVDGKSKRFGWYEDVHEAGKVATEVRERILQVGVAICEEALKRIGSHN